MPKGERARRKQAKPNFGPIKSKRTYENLKREAKNARARIKAHAKKTGDFTSAADAYTLESLLQRIENGETSRAILKELRNLRGANIERALPKEYKVDTSTGELIDVAKLNSAVEKANRSLARARKKYSDYASIFQEDLKADTIISNTTSDNYDQIMQYLKQFNASKLKPVTKPGYADVTTLLQYEHDINVLKEENKRREERNKLLKEGKVKVARKNANTFEPIPIDQIRSFHELHSRASTWEDIARTRRADNFLENYTGLLQQLQATYIENGFYNKTVADRFAYVYSVLDAVKGNADLITIMSLFYREIDISLFYGAAIGDVDFDGIYNDFCEFADEYLPDYE